MMRMRVPPQYLRSEPERQPPPPPYDPAIFFVSLFLREYLSTFCVLLLTSRLGGDMFLAGPIVNLYVNIVFRRPLINPFVLTLACASASDWKKANVSGFPGFNKEKTSRLTIFMFWVWLLVAQLTGAASAAGARAYGGHVLGDEFIRNAGGGAGQLALRVDGSATCWAAAGRMEIPIRLGNATALLRDGCMLNIQTRWWFTEDFAAGLFLIVAYVNIWRWLRWKDMAAGNPHDTTEQYWTNLVVFSAASAALGLMTAMAFPTANAGWHNSLFNYVFQELRPDLTVTANAHSEPLIRAIGGMFGCCMAMIYEWALTWMDKCRDEKKESKDQPYHAPCANFMHKVLYLSPL
jgi:hypothetical protein